MGAKTKRIAIVAIVALLAAVALIATKTSKGRRDDAAKVTSVTSKKHAQALSERLRTTASIAGRVSDQGTAPVAGARVCAEGYSHELPSRTLRVPRCAISDANGAYTIAGLVAAEYEVTASARGKRPATFEGKRIFIAADERRNAIDLVLADGGVELRGSVVDVTGGPIAGAVVQAGPRNTYAAMTETDAAGLFSLWVAPGEVWVRADANGYVSDTDYGTTDITFELVLTPASSISGTVIDAATNAPIAGIAVELGPDSYGGPADITDEQGRFLIDHLWPDRHLVVARGPHQFGASDGSILVGLAQDVSGVVIRVAPAARVSATVMMATTPPQPCPRPHLTIRASRSKDPMLDWGGDRLVGVGINGDVHVDGVLPGTYRADASCDDDSDDTTQSVEVGTADVTGLRFETRPGGVIRGHVRTREGVAVADARVRSNGNETSTDANGRYELTGLTPARYPIAVSSTLGATSGGSEVELSAGAIVEHDVVLETASRLEGRVVDTDGKPVANIDISVQPQASASNIMPVHFATSRNDGTFEIVGLVSGLYGVMLNERDENIALVGPEPDVDVRTPATATVKLVLEARTQSISGTVGDSGGAPVIDAFVVAARERDGKSAIAETRRNEWDLRVVTDDAGRFKLTALAAGGYTVRAMRRGGGEAFAEHVRTGGSVNLQIKQTGSIEGTVRSKVVPLRDIRVYCEQVGTGLGRDERFFQGEGHYVLRDLPAGDYFVVASVRGRRMKQRLTLFDGERRVGVDLDLDAGTALSGRVVDLQTRKPLAGIHVSVVPRGLGFNDEMGLERVTTDASGQFAFQWLPHGLVELNAYGDSDLAETRWLREVSGPSVDLGDVAMAKRGVDDGTLGITWKDYDRDFPSDQRRLEVAAVAPPAKGVLVPGDVITSVNGIDVTGTNRVAAYNLFDVAPGTSLRLGLARGETVTITAARR